MFAFAFGGRGAEPAATGCALGSIELNVLDAACKGPDQLRTPSAGRRCRAFAGVALACVMPCLAPGAAVAASDGGITIAVAGQQRAATLHRSAGLLAPVPTLHPGQWPQPQRSATAGLRVALLQLALVVLLCALNGGPGLRLGPVRLRPIRLRLLSVSVRAVIGVGGRPKRALAG